MLIIKNTSAKNSIFAPHAANFKNLFDTVQEMGRPKFKYSFTLISSGDTSNHSIGLMHILALRCYTASIKPSIKQSCDSFRLAHKQSFRFFPCNYKRPLGFSLLAMDYIATAT